MRSSLDYRQLTDRTLVELVIQDDPDALGELYDRYHRLVYSLALNTVRDNSAAEEITQDVFIRIWEKANTYQPERAKFSTWLTSIARYRSIDRLRRRGARPEQESVSWAEVSVSSQPIVDGPEETAAIRLQQERVRAAIAEIPPEQQEPIALAYFRGLSHRQIAEALDLPLGTVKTRIRLAMEKLRDLLSDEREQPG
jgi:RNA polymerase sigma-70 factor (ECF subfamily)